MRYCGRCELARLSRGDAEIERISAEMRRIATILSRVQSIRDAERLKLSEIPDVANGVIELDILIEESARALDGLTS